MLSVVDLDLDPPDPHVLMPPGSGSGSIVILRGMDPVPDTAPDPSIIKQK